MTGELIMYKGLPGSGKSTAAVKEVLDAPAGAVVRINKDSLRTMLHADRWKGKTEKQIVAARDALIGVFLGQGLRVIVDDTNLAPFHEDRLQFLAQEHGATFTVKDFTDVPLDVCLERDWKRCDSVGPKVIHKMWAQYLKPNPPPVGAGFLPAVICDLDGTLAHMDGRGPYDWGKVGEDILDEVVADLLENALAGNDHVLIVSGRDEVCRENTMEWLRRHHVAYSKLWMRPAGDMRPDREVKADIYEQHIKSRYNIKYVLDDRDSVVAFWRGKGLKVLQVEYGAF